MQDDNDPRLRGDVGCAYVIIVAVFTLTALLCICFANDSHQRRTKPHD